MASIRLENVTKVYKAGVRAVSDFSLTIEDGEFIVFVGPSGCGKSTTLRMIAGLEDITSGNVFIGDKYVNDLEPKDRNIAMVFQSYALYPHMTVYDNMAYSLRCHHAKKEEIEEKVQKAAAILGIQDLLKRTPRELSGGQRQRVALGRTIVREPSAFLFDEPLSNLDAKLRVQMRAEINKLHQDIRTTFVYVTHDQTEAMTMGDRIVVMKDGLIQQVDTPMNLYEHPANVFVATFLGSPQMNILKGEIAIEGKKKVFKSENGDFSTQIPDIDLCQIEESRYPLQAYLGVRPADVRIGDKGYETKVELVERLGEQTLVYFHLPGRKEFVIASLPSGSRLLENDIVKVSFDIEKLHLFSAEDETSLTNAVPYVKLGLDEVDSSLREKVGKRLVDPSEAPHHLVFSASEIREGKGDLSFEAKIEGKKDYGEESNYFARLKDGKVVPFRTPKSYKIGETLTLGVEEGKLNLASEGGERLTDDIVSELEPHEATLEFRPRGCFLSEGSLHNHEKAYQLVRLVKLGKKSIIELKGKEKGESLRYLVPSNDLTYVSMMVYMRKKLKA